MSHKNSSKITDLESINKSSRRGRPAASVEKMLDAAARLFSEGKDQQTITMDAVAIVAGVGKGTLFRAFGSREGLLDALWGRKLAELRVSFEHSGQNLAAAGRLESFFDQLLLFKITNGYLIRAREISPGSVLKSENYRWMLSVASGLIRQIPGHQDTAQAEYIAHTLLATLHIDLLDELLAAGRTLEDIRILQQQHIRQWAGAKAGGASDDASFRQLPTAT